MAYAADVELASVPNLPATRGYQQEMLDESLRRNIIIAMDTGSGKTHIAVLRLKIEVERQPRKVHFLDLISPLNSNQTSRPDLLVLRPNRFSLRTAVQCYQRGASRIRRSDIWLSRTQPVEGCRLVEESA